jgi:hypothetical protein
VTVDHCVSLKEPFPAPETVLAEMDYSHTTISAPWPGRVTRFGSPM